MELIQSLISLKMIIGRSLVHVKFWLLDIEVLMILPQVHLAYS